MIRETIVVSLHINDNTPKTFLTGNLIFSVNTYILIQFRYVNVLNAYKFIPHGLKQGKSLKLH